MVSDKPPDLLGHCGVPVNGARAMRVEPPDEYLVGERSYVIWAVCAR
jgi:hypothetical protein